MEWLQGASRFVRRHRGKLLLASAVGAGLYTLYTLHTKYTAIEAELARDASRRRARALRDHFDANHAAACKALGGLTRELSGAVRRLADSDAIVGRLKESGLSREEKRALWEEMKVVEVARVVGTVYAVALLCALVVVEFQLVGRYVSVERSRGGSVVGLPAGEVTKATQQRFIRRASPGRLVEAGADEGVTEPASKGLGSSPPGLLASRTREAVEEIVGGISLTAGLDGADLTRLVADVRQLVERDVAVVPGVLMLACRTDEGELADDVNFEALVQETRGIVESADFADLLVELMDVGFSQLERMLAENFTSGDASAEKVPLAKALPRLATISAELLSAGPASDEIHRLPRLVATLTSSPPLRHMGTIVFLSGDEDFNGAY